MVERSAPSQTWQLDEMATLETLVVLPEARAAGTGTALVERARDKLRAAGVKHWAVNVVATNEGGERFHRRHGFEPVFTELLARL
jgi:GNAT superfamily N-acetyltransferase